MRRMVPLKTRLLLGLAPIVSLSTTGIVPEVSVPTVPALIHPAKSFTLKAKAAFAMAVLVSPDVPMAACTALATKTIVDNVLVELFQICSIVFTPPLESLIPTDTGNPVA